MNNLIKITVIFFLLFSNAYAGSDGELEISKKTKQLEIVLKRSTGQHSLLTKD
jgi:hypothetical protein